MPLADSSKWWDCCGYLKHVQRAMRAEIPFDNPKQCPCGHKHLSWSGDEDEVYCWDCGKYYPITQCFGSQNAVSSTDEKQESLE
jgi:uncharacterized protein YbaR (Trm112 family)